MLNRGGGSDVAAPFPSYLCVSFILTHIDHAWINRVLCYPNGRHLRCTHGLNPDLREMRARCKFSCHSCSNPDPLWSWYRANIFNVYCYSSVHNRIIGIDKYVYRRWRVQDGGGGLELGKCPQPPFLPINFFLMILGPAAPPPNCRSGFPGRVFMHRRHWMQGCWVKKYGQWVDIHVFI